MAEKLGELLIKRNYITLDQLKKASEEQKVKGGRLESTLVRLGFIKEDELLSFLSAQYRVPSVKLSRIEVNPNVIKLIPSSIAKKYFIITVNRVGPKLTLAMADPSNIVVIDEIKFMTGFNVEAVVASEAEIIEAIKKYYGGEGSPSNAGTALFQASDYILEDDKNPENGISLIEDEMIDVGEFDKLVHGAVDNVEVIDSQVQEDLAEIEGPIIKIVNGILIRAIKLGVSDIHFEPYEKMLRVRYRIDGVMRREMALPVQIKNAVTSRLKIMAKLDRAGSRIGQKRC